MKRRFLNWWQNVRANYLNREALSSHWYYYKMGYWMDDHGALTEESRDKCPPNIFLFAWEMLGWALAGIACIFLDHKWEEDGHAGPDSGWIEMNCTRCGECHHTTLY